MKGLVAAMQFLTRLPLPRIEVSDADFSASIRFFPAAGLVIGALVVGGAFAGTLIDSWTGALVALLCWVLVTGGLHLDGVADIADAKGAIHKGGEHLLRLLTDPHIGSFGAIAIVMQLLAKLVLLHGVIESGVFWQLVAVPAAARVGPLVWARWLPPLHQGLASRFSDQARPPETLMWLLVIAAVSPLAPALLLAPIFIVGWGWHLKRMLGGISGDGHGAGIELVETGLLAAIILIARF